ncbi:MAG: NAD(P)H-dependent oxidoreductase subunit E, partial [Hyphomicrobiaceae bacterium]
VLEIATFYTMFQLAPVGRKAHVQVCGTTPCMLRGAEELRALCQKRIHQQPHHISDDGAFSWEEVECLGACVNAPMVQIGKDTYEDLTPASLEAILDAFAKGQKPRTGPQIERYLSAPAGEITTLRETPRGPLGDGGYGGTSRGDGPATDAARPSEKKTSSPDDAEGDV